MILLWKVDKQNLMENAQPSNFSRRQKTCRYCIVCNGDRRHNVPDSRRIAESDHDPVFFLCGIGNRKFIEQPH